MKEYIDSLKNPNKFTSGDPDLLPKDLYDKYGAWESLDETYQAERGYLAPEDKKASIEAITKARSEYLSSLNDACITYIKQQKEADVQAEINNQSNEITMETGSIKDYLDSLTQPNNYLSGNTELLPEDLKEKYLQFASLEEAYFSGDRFNRKDNHAPYTEALKTARTDYYEALLSACEEYKNQLNTENMAKKKKEKVPLDKGHLENPEERKQTNDVKTETKPEQKPEAKQERKPREPQMVTVNGDKITHAHAYKSNNGEDWFYIAKINGKPMKAQLMDKADVEKVLEHTSPVKEMMEKYYPSVLLPKVNVSEFKLPKTITTANGEEQVLKFNVYKETKEGSPDLGKYRLYAQVGDAKMSCNASKQDLDAYFNRVTTPVQLITKNFGDKLGIKAYYEQFKLPEGMNIEGKNVLITKNQKTNRYEISVNVPDKFQTPSKEISYDDRRSYFQHNVATKEQLAAKYLSHELSSLSKTQKTAVEKHVGMSR